MRQSIKNVILSKALVAVSGWMQLLQLADNSILVHLLHLLLLQDVSDVIDDPGGLVVVSEAIILLISSHVGFLLLIHLLQSLEAEVHQLDSLVYVWLSDCVSELEFGHGLRDSDNGE
jgi:hypothetical protein